MSLHTPPPWSVFRKQELHPSRKTQGAQRKGTKSNNREIARWAEKKVHWSFRRRVFWSHTHQDHPERTEADTPAGVTVPEVATATPKPTTDVNGAWLSRTGSQRPGCQPAVEKAHGDLTGCSFLLFYPFNLHFSTCWAEIHKERTRTHHS